MNHSLSFSLEDYLADKKNIIDQALDRLLPSKENYPHVIFEAIRYSVFAGGKRIRPILCLAAAEATGHATEEELPIFLTVACSLEMIHTYSLIHDDLPALDNDDYRRGALTAHKLFGEDMAILAGDALLTEAFHILSRRDITERIKPQIQLEIMNIISRAAGMMGMISGQVVDLQSEGHEVDADTLFYMHQRKTGDLIRASVQSGALLTGAEKTAMDALSQYGNNIGLCFQITDDLLNVDGDAVLLGKGTGSDAARGKVTFPALFGYEGSKRLAERMAVEAVECLSSFDHRALPLRELARFIVRRKS